MAEVSKQVQPLHDWQLAFWSNGSGRPPGFFQTRIKSDDERFGRLQAETKEQSEVLKRLDTNLTEITLEKKIEAAAKERRAKRFAFWFPIVKWVVVGLTGAMITVGSWAFTKIEPVVKILWDDYLTAHPDVNRKVKSLSSVSPGMDAKNPQISGDDPRLTQ